MDGAVMTLRKSSFWSRRIWDAISSFHQASTHFKNASVMNMMWWMPTRWDCIESCYWKDLGSIGKDFSFFFSGEQCRKNLIFFNSKSKRARVSQGKHLKQAERPSPLLEIPKKIKRPLVQRWRIMWWRVNRFVRYR
jgi:hypothetical protein